MLRRLPFTEMLKDGPDSIAFFCRVLADESASIEDRREAAEKLKPLYHPKLAKMGALLERFGD